MKLNNIDFYYFSGTGNTLLIVRKMQDIFQENGIKTQLYKIEESEPGQINLKHTIGIGFPVAVFSTYPFVWDFIKALPPANGTEIFMVDTMGGFSGGIVGPMREIIANKGYKPVGAREIMMPPNIFYIQDEDTCQRKVKKGLKKAEKYALELIKGNAHWNRIPVLSDTMHLISRGALKLTGVKLNQKLFLFDVNPENCNQCGICVDLCPVHNIKMEKGKYPEHGLKCEYCLRCVSFCPKKAMPCKFNYKKKTYRAVKAKEFLKQD